MELCEICGIGYYLPSGKCDHCGTGRAYRRHHSRRVKIKAKHVAKSIWGAVSKEQIDHAVKNADNLKYCSCEACRNPRRSGWRKNKGKTIREIRADEDLHERG